jgi:hypothetical protein
VTAAILMSILAGDKRHGIEPFEYVRQLLIALSTSGVDLRSLLPDASLKLFEILLSHDSAGVSCTFARPRPTGAWSGSRLGCTRHASPNRRTPPSAQSERERL